MSKRVSKLHLAGVATALALMTAPAYAQGGGNSAANMARRDSCYTAVTGDTAKLSAKIAKATAGGATQQEANRQVMSAMDSTQRRAVMTCVRPNGTTGRTTGSSTGDVALNNNRARSQTRIPVSKEPVRDTVIAAPVEPPPPPPAPAPEPPPPPPPAPAPEAAVYTPPPAPMVVKRYGNWYIGFGGGAAIPLEESRRAYDEGVNFNVPIGWESENNVLGFRLNFGYSKFEGRTNFRCTGTSVPCSGSTVGTRLPNQDPQIWSGMADLTLRVPFLGTWGGPMTGLYLVGGGGYNKFSDWYDNFALTNPDVNGSSSSVNKEAVTAFAANAGGGLRVGLGIADIFVESRYVHAFTPGHNISYVPVLLGLSLRP
jgi:hypothetical protein